jgi:hypothetical protein
MVSPSVLGLDNNCAPPPQRHRVAEARAGIVGTNWNDNVADSTALVGQYVVSPACRQPEQRADDISRLRYNCHSMRQLAWDVQRVVSQKTRPPTTIRSGSVLDIGGWTLWNNMGSSSSWGVVKAPVTYNVSAGSHTLLCRSAENGPSSTRSGI